MTTIFNRLARARPAEAASELRAEKPEQLLLTFLQRWPKPTISARDIRIWGPGRAIVSGDQEEPSATKKVQSDQPKFWPRMGGLSPSRNTNGRSFGNSPNPPVARSTEYPEFPAEDYFQAKDNQKSLRKFPSPLPGNSFRPKKTRT